MDTVKKSTRKTSLYGIQRLILRTQLILILSLALILGLTGTLINLHYETIKRDLNLQNIAEAIAHSPMLTQKNPDDPVNRERFSEYLDALKDTLSDIDVISVVDRNGIRVYHSNRALIGTVYDGNIPDFESQKDIFYAANETGPSGSQRRAYAAVYDEEGEYIGVVMAIMLMKNIKNETAQMLLIFLMITLLAIIIELILANRLSVSVKKSLMGYEPDVIATMYKLRDTILETLTEGILAFDDAGTIQFANLSAIQMLCDNPQKKIVGQPVEYLNDAVLSQTVKNGHWERNIQLSRTNIILDRAPIKENGHIVGSVAILHNREEYTRLMEELAGTRYLVDSMRANNHDFTNKLHVILGLIQMQRYHEASAYIQSITMVQRESISKITKTITEPAVAALLIGKIARASELNIHFILHEGCCYCASDLNLPAEMLVSVIGNLLDNAFEAMNQTTDYKEQKELTFGIYSKPGVLLITVDDTGCGIKPENLDLIFQKGYSTKGEGRGTGLYQVQKIVESFGGKICVESQDRVGSSFSVSFTKDMVCTK